MSEATGVVTAQEPNSSTLYFGPWYRKLPYFEATLRHGCTAYDNYNHMYLPSYFRDPVFTACNKRDPGSGCAARIAIAPSSVAE